jgi:hypothetical protein
MEKISPKILSKLQRAVGVLSFAVAVEVDEKVVPFVVVEVVAVVLMGYQGKDQVVVLTHPKNRHPAYFRNHCFCYNFG